ncbi:winged helix-turn-helix domain-containing protein [Microbacterium lushaniae]|uniref:Winged helix-turn-helix transcriptional regulator n=1 Tax=Microbacterium lushaniae TaxID=2614639 RepID=A0A5J5JKD6_9MICO|nr:winged helix-turn-helix domain-containing protein [Microbacterium lushaniae]KAA9155877.1 winged helix-turn-helix transcriptional regulator [Microbacterium lushaniae]KAA9157648.1 winged helix-turn-helix transcriptional regulator [Microbacterium lushaniae]QEW04173.1 winged helix-turn-helix transcriptional regulator [Microbacterium lushaniae]
MSTPALLDRPAPTRHLRAVPTPSAPEPAPSAAHHLPPGTAPRGFALYVGIDESKAAADGVSLGVLVEALRRTLADLAPSAQTYATVALAPTGTGGRDVDVVRLALHEPSAVARTKQEPDEADDLAGGVVVDISRKRVLIDGESAAFTFKEFELLQYLVLREGRTIDRSELVASLWQNPTDDDAPGERTIDVHVRRLRAKLGRFEDIVRTVRGVGYRFDRHADVAIRFGHGTPSPDRV